MKSDLFHLRFEGGMADDGQLNVYDGASSYEGFGRFLLLAGHYYATGKIMTKAPFSEADVRISSPREGSFLLTVAAGVAAGVIVVPFGYFIKHLLDKAFPSHDPQMQKVYEELKEANKLKRKELGIEPMSWAQIESYDEELKKHTAELQTLRSIVTPALSRAMRPVGRSAKTVQVSTGKDMMPIRALNENMVRQIDADIIDDTGVVTTGVVNDFSQSTQKGFVWDDREGRRIRFHFDADKLPKRNDLSWSLYEQAPLALHGIYVRYLDGAVKKILIRRTERIPADERMDIDPLPVNPKLLH